MQISCFINTVKEYTAKFFHFSRECRPCCKMQKVKKWAWNAKSEAIYPATHFLFFAFRNRIFCNKCMADFTSPTNLCILVFLQSGVTFHWYGAALVSGTFVYDCKRMSSFEIQGGLVLTGRTRGHMCQFVRVLSQCPLSWEESEQFSLEFSKNYSKFYSKY